MKILHTADWHVGKSMRGRSRAAEHEAVLAEIAGLARAEQVDLVLVVGDVFETAAPTPEAEAIVYRALLDLASTGAAVIVVAGNHDNARRLQALEPVFDLVDVVVRASVRPADEGGVIEGTTKGGERWRVATVPFLSQRYVVHAADLLDRDGSEHAGEYSSRVHRIIGALTSAFDADAVDLVAAHLHVIGGLLGGGERAAQTVFDYGVSTAGFPVSAHYVALGHLHRAQSLAGPCPIRYSGSPLQLDFGEVSDAKSVAIIDAAKGRPAAVREIPLQSGRRLRTVRGTMAELTALAAGDGGAGSHPASGEDEAWLKVIVRERPRLGLADDVRALLPDAVDVVVEDPRRDADDAGGAPVESARAGRSPQELFRSYLESTEGQLDGALVALFDDLLEEVGA